MVQLIGTSTLFSFATSKIKDTFVLQSVISISKPLVTFFLDLICTH